AKPSGQSVLWLYDIAGTSHSSRQIICCQEYVMCTQHNADSPQDVKSGSDKPERAYEQSGLYHRNGKPYRVFALLGWRAGVVVFMAVAAAILDLVLRPR